MGTTLLQSGKIVDGTGNQAFDGSVLLDGDQIRAVFRQGDEIPLADTIIDVSGCVISPGFIDMHSHMDCMLPLEDHPTHLKCMLEQGITTVVGGNCGISPAPVTTETFGLLDSFAVFATCIEKPLDYTWRSMGEFLKKIEERKPIINLAQLVGHGTVRITTSKTRRGTMKPDELKNCLDTVQQSLDEGACGLSFGLGYEPGMFSSNEEVEAFNKVAAKADKPVAVHLKSYVKLSPAYPLKFSKPYFMSHNLLALKEMIDIARRTGVKLQISHLMLVGRKTWPLAYECLRMIEKHEAKA